MTTTFWIIAILLGVLAAVFVLLPLYTGRARQDDEGEIEPRDRTGINVGLYEERLAELREALEAGEIDQDAFDDLHAELQKNLLQDTGDNVDSSNPLQPGAGRLPLVLAALVPVFAIFAYSELGLSWGSIGDLELARELGTTSANPHDVSGIEQSVAKLAQRLRSQPDNDQGWFLLAQSYMNLELYQKAAEAYGHIAERYPQDPDISAYQAEALFMASGRLITPEVEALVAKTQELDPSNISMFEIRAMDAFTRGKPADAIKHFRGALAAGAQGERARMINEAIDTISDIMKESGMEAPEAATAQTTTAMAVPPARAIDVTVDIADAVQTDATESVFVFARALDGPPMPLAVQKMTVGALPTRVTLDSSMAMMEGMGLDDFDQVEVVARISSSGIANASAEDYEAVSPPVDLTTEQNSINLTIEKRRGERQP